MSYIFNLLLILFFIVLKTSIMPQIIFLVDFYDIVLIAIIFISYDRSLSVSILSLIMGIFLVETISIAPFGIYLTTYLWVFIFIKLTQNILEKSFAVTIIFIFSIIFENSIFAFVLKLINPDFEIFNFLYKVLPKQLLWGIVTAYLIFLSILKVKKKIDKTLSFITKNVILKNK